MGRPKIPIPERFEKHTIWSMDGCRLWTAATNKDGYGKISVPRDGFDWRNGYRTTTAHIIAWEQAHGPVPGGLSIDHICRQPLCCNVDHLRLLTLAENTMEPRSQALGAVNSRKVVCSRGHDNWRHYTYKGRRWRQCKTCRNVSHAQYRERRQAAGGEW